MNADLRQPLIQWSNARVAVPLVALQTLIYMTLNHRSLEGSTETPAILLDGVLGFQVWTVWAYVALIATPIVMALMIRSRDVFRRAIVAYVVAMSITFLIIFSYPTHCPRPAPPTDSSWSSWAYRSLIAVDGPGCAFPSGHVIVPTVLCWAIWRDRHPYRVGALIWLIVSVPSILTTKQHHAADLFGGLIVAGFGIVVGQLPVPRPSRSSGQG